MCLKKPHISRPVGIVVRYLNGFMFERKKSVKRNTCNSSFYSWGAKCHEILSPGLKLSDVWSQGCLHPIRNNQTSVSMLDHSLHNDSGITVTYKHMDTCTNI